MANYIHQLQFLEIWAAALDRYRTECGYDLTASSSVNPTSVEEFKQQIENSESRFKEYRNAKNALWSSASGFLIPVEKIGQIVAEGAGVVFAPAPAIMRAVALLIKGAGDVSQCYDYIEGLLSYMKAILDRLDIHTEYTIDSRLKDIYTEILACILETIGVSTKYVKAGRFKRYLRKIFTEDDKVNRLKDRLDALVGQEIAIVGALNLNSMMDVLEQTTTTAVVTTDMDGKVDCIAKSVQQISLDLQTATSVMATSNAGLPSTNIRSLLDPQTSVEDDLESINCLPGTGSWLLSEPLINKWIDGETPLLFLSGGPGTGKSYLSSFLIKHLRDTKSKNLDTPSVGYFFFKGDTDSRTDFVISLKTMAYQLTISDKVYSSYLESISNDLTSSNTTIFALWRRLFLSRCGESSAQRIYLVFDGIDEAKQADLESFLEPLIKVLEPPSSGVSKISVLLVGRPDVAWKMEEVFYEHLVPVIDVDARKNSQDIRKFLLHRLTKYKNLVRMKAIQSEITDKLIAGGNGMFLWVDLMLKELSTKDRESTVRKALDNMPKTLEELYRRMLTRVSEALADEPEQAQDFNELLMWTAFAFRPLSLTDLGFILSLRYGTGEGVNSSGLFDTISKKYASFFMLSNSMAQGRPGLSLDGTWFDTKQKNEEEAEDDGDLEFEEWFLNLRDSVTAVRPRHASFREFLKGQIAKPSLIGIVATDAKLHILKTCLRVLLNPESMPSEDTNWGINVMDVLNSQRIKSGIIFSTYAMRYWTTHLQALDISSTPIHEKVSILTSIHKIHTLPSVVTAQFMFPERSDIDIMSVTGEEVDTILAWVRDEETVRGCGNDVQEWAAKVRENRRELVVPLVAQLYQHALCGKSNILQSWSEVLPSSRRILRALVVYLDKFYPSIIPNNNFASDNYLNPIMPASVVKSIFRYPSLEEDALWHGGIACFMVMTGNKPEAIEFFEKAIQKSADDSRHKLMFWKFLAQASAEAGDDKAASAYIKQIFDAIDTSFGGLEQIPTSGSFYSRPWELDRENAAKLVHWLATLHQDYENRENIDEEIAYYRKAITLNIHDDTIVDGVFERALKDPRWTETALFAVKLMRETPAIQQTISSPIPRNLSYFCVGMWNGKASGLFHPVLKMMGEPSEDILAIWGMALEGDKFFDDRGVPYVSNKSGIEYAKILEIEGQIDKGIDMVEEVVGRHMRALQTAICPSAPSDAKEMFEAMASFLARHLFDEDQRQDIRERCLRIMETICKDISPIIPDVEIWFAASMGLYYQKQGRKAEAIERFKKQAETALRYLEDEDTVFFGWSALARLANAIDDPQSMGGTIWSSMTQPHSRYSLDDSEYYENKHGRRWPLNRVKSLISCASCRRKVLIPGSPANICRLVGYDVFCNWCMEKIKARSHPAIKFCSLKYGWWIIDIAEFPGPRQEGISDEEEKKSVLDSFRKGFFIDKLVDS
ncbi:hypothetical protein TWF730_008564 [Orbilia blumenaviensis]|uniref:NACHT domain-containing protein n=1 Tax=Orbilia blumenaviensis TaxID=1796055 RepID=A0AAV9V6J5_9PEZI